MRGSSRVFLLVRIICSPVALAAAETQCEIYANNDQVICFPDAGSYVYQNQWAGVVCEYLNVYVFPALNLK